MVGGRKYCLSLETGVGVGLVGKFTFRVREGWW